LTAAQHQLRKLLERAIDELPESLRTVFVVLGDQIAANLNDVFPFERQRCDLLVERVLKQVGLRK
jgi:hypothetical protein